MTEKEKSLIEDYYLGLLPKESFHEQFPVDINSDKQYVIQEINKAIESQNLEELNCAIDLLFLVDDDLYFIDTYNSLIIEPNHNYHQRIVRHIQNLKHPSSVEFIRKALLTKYDYLKYAGSESDAITSWFSHALFDIGTKEAIEVIREFSTSEDEGIREGMIYRLSKLGKYK